MNESMILELCNKHKIIPRIFPQTNTILIETGLDTWKIIIQNTKNKPVVVYHQNKLRQLAKFHYQNRVNTINQAIDCILTHKNVLKSHANIYSTKR